MLPGAGRWKGTLRGGAGVLEPRESDERRNSYRTVYSVKFDDAVYVLHAFQKKSKRGADMDVDIVVKPKPKSRGAARIKGRIAA